MNADLKDAKILIVDDQQANIDVLETLLDMQGYTQFKSTTRAEESLSLINSFKPDLLLLDLMMPGLNGYEIMDHLKESKQLNPSMPILVLTADATNEAKKRSLQGGASDFVTKPFDLIEVGLRIRNLLTNVFLMTQLRLQNSVLEEKVKERTAALRVTIEALTESKSRMEHSLTTIEMQNTVLRDIAWTQSHVVRAPLSRLMGIIDLMYEECSTDDSRHQIISMMNDSARELDNIVKDISDKAYKANLFDPKQSHADTD
jgi:CheY-like chemotaxis protein